ncbi:protein-L-isoaspartate carboxylmethyltransferase [Microbacterium dextranolyticum]|uniref:Protein-L-isoaspartate carboxylmethyltransferase n=1 Tax=Microbacterium dextranolyticum TaxID=36806 RepID=A0A9W6HLB8_9MICO|nr:protein-L-isoaspartate carboxylmethyltransferase [Microbacterium dextranolyticum]MBM7464158.1 hypothetical protein [Microbacterium dextranolyticum]GLJ95153.1 hypothetical protein GCM10017591_12150 [Microbacterium dextranolyticum]
MPYRNQATIQAWVDDYLAAAPDETTAITVLEKDFTPGPESGMVVVSLANASTVTYIQAVNADTVPRWVVTFEPRSDSFDLDAEGVARLAADLAMISSLCAYLQRRTDDIIAGTAGVTVPPSAGASALA